jgi:hypothetical protein
MTTSRFSVIGIALLVVLLGVWLTVRSTENRAQVAAKQISKSCKLNVHATRGGGDNRFGLAIDAIHYACPGPGSEKKVACARREISKSGFPEVKELYTGSCPERGIFE